MAVAQALRPLAPRGLEDESRPFEVTSVAKTPDGIRVMIYDQEYNMKGDLDPEYIEKLAKFLDGKMRSIAARSRTVDSLRVAVLAGLNLADEYHQLKTKYDATHKEVGEKVGECSDLLDQILKSDD